MSVAKKLTIIFFTLVVACGESPKKGDIIDKNPLLELEGFWNRIGTIQTVNGVPVDTVYLSDSDTPDLRQIKVFYDGNLTWINNNYNSSLPWKGGNGMYGKYQLVSKDSLLEKISHGTGLMAEWIKSYKDSLGIDARTYKWGFSLPEDSKLLYFVEPDSDQIVETDYAELWEKMPDASPESKADGVWKRVYEIQYANGIPIDTVSVPSDGTLDIHFRKNGRFIYQVDNTGLSEPGEGLFYGYGGYGQFEFIDENKIIEYHEFVSGRTDSVIQNPPKTVGQAIELEFYNDDLFKQVQLDSVGVKLRGVVYERVQ
jgi:hypothetical protein